MRIANYLRPDCVALRQRADSLTGAVQQMAKTGSTKPYII